LTARLPGVRVAVLVVVAVVTLAQIRASYALLIAFTVLLLAVRFAAIASFKVSLFTGLLLNHVAAFLFRCQVEL